MVPPSASAAVGAGRECATVRVQFWAGKPITRTEFSHAESGFPSPAALSMRDLSTLSLELVRTGERRMFGSEGFTNV